MHLKSTIQCIYTYEFSGLHMKWAVKFKSICHYAIQYWMSWCISYYCIIWINELNENYVCKSQYISIKHIHSIGKFVQKMFWMLHDPMDHTWHWLSSVILIMDIVNHSAGLITSYHLFDAVVRGKITPPDEAVFTNKNTNTISGVLCFSDTSFWCLVRILWVKQCPLNCIQSWWNSSINYMLVYLDTILYSDKYNYMDFWDSNLQWLSFKICLHCLLFLLVVFCCVIMYAICLYCKCMCIHMH